MKQDRPPYKYLRWWLIMPLMAPLIAVAILAYLTSEILGVVGEMLVDAGEWIYSFEWELLDRLHKWIFFQK